MLYIFIDTCSGQLVLIEVVVEIYTWNNSILWLVLLSHATCTNYRRGHYGNNTDNLKQRFTFAISNITNNPKFANRCRNYYKSTLQRLTLVSRWQSFVYQLIWKITNLYNSQYNNKRVEIYSIYDQQMWILKQQSYPSQVSW